ncbi:MAG: MBL fold metallo-hydrolase [Granulosicoccus sp.]
MLKVAALGSGSSGNSLVVQAGQTTVLVDCGFTMKETIVRLDHLGLTPGDIDALLLTHEHGDHVKGAGPLSRKFGLPVWSTFGTYHQARDNRFASVRLFHAHEPFEVGELQVDPFPTPHDAAESSQFVFSAAGIKFAMVTDLGTCTPHVAEKLSGIHGLVVECNYDTAMLKNGPYPPSLQARIRSNYGHLGNEQAGALLNQIDHAQLGWILLGHLSEQNNSDAMALSTVHRYLAAGHDRVHVLAQHCCSPWFSITNPRNSIALPCRELAHGSLNVIAEKLAVPELVS